MMLARVLMASLLYRQTECPSCSTKRARATARPLLADAYDVAKGAQVELAIHHCGGGLGALVEGDSFDQFVFVGGVDDDHLAGFGEVVEAVVEADRRGVVVAAGFFLPEDFAGVGSHAGDGAAGVGP